MKPYMVLLVLTLAWSLSYGQQEFFQDKNGYTASFSIGATGVDWEDLFLNKGYMGIGQSMRLGPGILTGLAVVINEDGPSLGLSAGYQSRIQGNNYSVYPVMLVNYTEQNFWGLTSGLSLVFLEQSSFPFSLNGSLSVLSKDFPFDDFSLAYQVFHFSYHQAFWAKKNVYPVLGVSYSLNSIDIHSLSLHLGFNFVLN